MKRFSVPVGAGLATVVLLAARLALAANVPDCLAVNAICNVVDPTTCTVNATQTLQIPAGGTFTCIVDRDLLITASGSLVIPVPAAGVPQAVRTLNLTVNNSSGGGTGSMTMQPGAVITGDTPANNQVAATINISVQDFVDLQSNGTGAKITSNQAGNGCSSAGHAGIINITANHTSTSASDFAISVGIKAVISVNGSNCPAGDIVIKAPNGHIVIDGTVESAVDTGSTGSASRSEDGGPITIQAACDLLVTGKVSSRGRDNGADRVHLDAGCTVEVIGLVESIGAGHAAPDIDNFCKAPERPDKPASSAACVEIWSGGTIVIDGPSGALVRADTGNGGVSGTSWIDIFSVLKTTITGPSANAAAGAPPFVVHANGDGGSNDNGGIVTVKSREDMVSVTGLGLQASAPAGAGDGGTVTVDAKLDVDLTGGTIEARGSTIGGTPNGGHVNVRSFGTAPASGSILAIATSLIDVTGGNPANGTIDLTACDQIQFPPGLTAPAAVVPTQTTGVCGNFPIFPDYVVFQTCTCERLPGNEPCLKAEIRAALDPATGRFPGNLGPDITVQAHLGGSIQNAVDTVTDSNGDGYIIVLVLGKGGGLLGGHVNQSVEVNRNYSLPFGLLACSVTMHTPDGGVATGHITNAANAPVPPFNPPVPPNGTGNIFVMDLHGADSGVAGWLIDGNGRYMRNTYGIDSAIGVHFVGNNNTMHGGKGEGNSGVGILVEGNNNKVHDADAFSNGGHGVQVVGNTNILEKLDAGARGKANSGDGLHVSGALDDSASATGNQILECHAFSNFGYGIFVKGSSHIIKKNDVGDRNKENALDGLHVEGNSNQILENDAIANFGGGLSVVGNGNLLKLNRAGADLNKSNLGNGLTVTGSNNTLDSNKANANGGDGFNITTAPVAGPGNKLLANKSNEGNPAGSKENAGCEYQFADGLSLDLGSNKLDKKNFVGSGAPKKYAAGCYENP